VGGEDDLISLFASDNPIKKVNKSRGSAAAQGSHIAFPTARVDSLFIAGRGKSYCALPIALARPILIKAEPIKRSASHKIH
jgi:hypothetical protein